MSLNCPKVRLAPKLGLNILGRVDYPINRRENWALAGRGFMVSPWHVPEP